jgi:hypothetical protein
MDMTIKITTHEKLKEEDRKYWKSLSPEERLDIVEQLRIEAGKFLYEYPARFQRIITVTRKADAEELKDK